jgi:hypothetical protein
VTSIEKLAARFRAHARDQAARSPLSARLSLSIADDPAVIALLQSAPPPQQLPVLLLAAVHSIVLAEPELELAAWYPSVTGEPRHGDPYPAFASLCRSRRHEIERLLSTRHTQTNEVARCALFVPPLAAIAAEIGPIALVDVGTSAGLNLQLDRYHYTYLPGGEVGTTSTVEIVAGTRGAVPVPAGLPAIVARIGIDPQPIELADADQARWLRACVWPDQRDRLHRLEAAIEIALANPPDIRKGTAVGDVAVCVEQASNSGHPVVLNSWVLNYLTADERRAYVAELDRLGAGRDLSWLYAEAPAMCDGVPFASGNDGEHRTVLTLVTWRAGRRTLQQLAIAHPHAYWIQWGERI